MRATKSKKLVLDHLVLPLPMVPYYFKGNLQTINSIKVLHSVEAEILADVEVPTLD